jgi:hypothetical protein
VSRNPWSVPREWDGERCFVLCGGASLQRELVPQLKGRIIAIKQAVKLRPNADVMFVSGRDDPKVCASYFPLYEGPRIVCRHDYPGMPVGTYHLRRVKGGGYSRDPQLLGGLDAGASAINLAALFGAREIVLLGMDMTGGRWVKRHHLPVIPQRHFDLHLAGLAEMAPEIAKDGVRVVNCSPVSVVPFFEKRPIEEFL